MGKSNLTQQRPILKNITKFVPLALAGLGAACLVGCTSMSTTGIVKKVTFGKMSDGTPIDLYTLRNSSGMEATIMTYGGIVTSVSYTHLDVYKRQ